MDGGQNVNKLKALSVLFRCAELYRDNLVGNNLLFVCSDKHLNVKMFPAAFLAGNFMHLTGVKFKGKAQSVKWDHVKLPSEYSYLDIPTE